MIEQAMYFALGFCAAALISLAVLPAFWDRAQRLTRRRLEAQMAMSPEQITAARDQLRAEFAVMQRRTELQLEAALARRHDDLAEIGRRIAMIHDIENRLAASASNVTALESIIADNAVKTAALAEELATLKKEHLQLQSTHGELSEQHANLSAELESINQVANERHAELLSSDTLIAGVKARSRDLETMLATSRNEVSARNKALRDLERAHRELTSEFSATSQRLAQTEERLRDIESELASQSAERSALAEKLAVTEAQLRSTTATEVEVGRALEAEAKRAQLLEAKLAKQEAKAKQAQNELEDLIDRLRAEKNLAEGALEKARADRGRLQTELRALRPANDTPAPPHDTAEEMALPRAIQAGE